jgi:hypothetical protein
MSNEYLDEKIEEREPDWEQKKIDVEKEYVHLQATMHKNTSMNMNREIQQRMYNKFDTEYAVRCLRWIYELTGIHPPQGGFWSALRDGFLLSRLLIALHPPYGEKWSPRPIKATGVGVFKARAQVTEFITRARQYGASSTITVDNLYDGTNLSQVLTIIGALSKEAEKRNFNGPTMIAHRKKGSPSVLMKRPSMTGFDLEESLDTCDSARGDTLRGKRCTVVAKFREGDKIDFLLLHSKNWLYEWAPGTVLKFKSNLNSKLDLPDEPEYSVIATNPEIYGLDPNEAITVPTNYIRPQCEEKLQLISSDMKVIPDGGSENKIVPIVQELIETEETYYAGLSNIIIRYYDCLFVDGSKRILPESYKSKILYYDLETFFNMHRELFKMLKRTRSIPGVIVANCDWLKMYCKYCNNYESLLVEIRKLRQKREVNARWLDIEKKVKLNIESLLITPIQRIPRYELLLGQMLKYTSKNHPQRVTLKFAKAKIEMIARKLNDAKDRIERSTKFLKALDMVTEVPSDIKLWASDRYFIKEQEFRRKSTSMYYTVKNVRLLLFNDMLVYIEKSGKFKQRIMLNSISAVRPFSKENLKEGAFAIQIRIRGADSVEVFAKDEVIQNEWVKLILDQRGIYTSPRFSAKNPMTSTTTMHNSDFLRDLIVSRAAV